MLVASGVAVGVIGIHENRQGGGSDRVAHHGAVLAVLGEVNVRVSEPGTDEREPADLVGGVPGLLDDLRRQGVVRHWEKQRSVRVVHLAPRLPPALLPLGLNHVISHRV
jgi:hypothetical protein